MIDMRFACRGSDGGGAVNACFAQMMMLMLNFETALTRRSRELNI